MSLEHFISIHDITKDEFNHLMDLGFRLKKETKMGIAHPILKGKVLDVAVDIRKGSPTFGKHVAVELSAENQRQLFIPRDFLHGFSVLSEEAIFAYKCDNLYCKEAEFGIRYDDPEIGIDWKIPADKIITSEKDRLANRLEDIPNER